MSVKSPLMSLAAAVMAAGAVLAGPAGAAHAATVKAVDSAATVCVNDPGLSLSRCFGYTWHDDLAPGEFHDHILNAPESGQSVGRYYAVFTVRVGVSAVKLTYGAAYAWAVERHLKLVSSGQTANANVHDKSKLTLYWPPSTGGFTDAAKDDLNLGAPYPGSTTLSYTSHAS
ncbi:hypothetical protein [Sphaerisporangium rhizosphaerae]|uniref:Secreted protein n=1 Tax=Sphaerisporangium rhizosphaerae TaxID=2269375 RepID=A0ABW2PH33_9ACTN